MKRRKSRKARRKCRNPRSRRRLKYADMYRRAVRARGGKKALRLHLRFWGLKVVPEMKVFGSGKMGTPLAGLGRSPSVILANGPMGRATKFKRMRHAGTLACSPNGKKLYILRSNRGLSKRKKLVGWATTTEYIPTRGIEKAGSFKSGQFWIHKHADDKGKWPKVYRDSNGNYHYGLGTYKVGKWIER